MERGIGMQSLPQNDIDLQRLAVIHFPGFGSRSLKKIRETFGDIGCAWSASTKKLSYIGLSEKKQASFQLWKKTFDLQKAIYRLASNQIAPLFLHDLDYPPLLGQISDPPEVLFIRGNLSAAPAIALIGSRKHTLYGKSVVERLVQDLGAQGLTIVSGLALGIDGLAHRAALQSKANTIAVLGSGVDAESIYPREHTHLAADIVEAGGVLMSEFPPGTRTRKEYFPMRNRIIAGLSLATVVIEARKKSGSLITARLALDSNREVLAVPGSIWSRSSEGCHHLIESGARPCVSAQSVLDAIALDHPTLAAEARAALPLGPLERRILDLLSAPMHIDDLTRTEQMSPAEAATALSLLELKGYVSQTGGQHWVSCSGLRSAPA